MTPIKLRKIKGQVIRRTFAPGSKSEHQAVCLMDAKQHCFRLRRLGGDPFYDSELEALVGKTISAAGEVVHGNTLILREWTQI